MTYHGFDYKDRAEEIAKLQATQKGRMANFEASQKAQKERRKPNRIF